MEKIRKKRGANTTEEQKNLLIEYMAKHDKLVSGKFTENFKYSDAKLQWTELSNILNSCNGANRTWKEWRKTWQDMRSRTKTKNSEARKSLNKTGGGECSKNIFTDNEEKILQIVGKTLLEGHQNSRESYVKLIENENTSYNDDNMDFELIFDDNAETQNNCKIATEEVEMIHSATCVDLTQNKNMCDLDIENQQQEISKTLNVPEKAKTKRRAGTAAHKQLNNSASATLNLANVTEKTYNLKEKYYAKKLEMKNKYYEDKIMLLKRDVESKEKIAENLLKIVNHLVASP